MSVAANKAVVLQFFEDVPDGPRRQPSDLFTATAVRHFPPGDILVNDPNANLPKPPPGASLTTDVHHVVGEGDLVMVHLTHRVKSPPGFVFPTRVGEVDIGQSPVEWNAMVVFRFEGTKIAEEWVVRDELQVLQQIGIVGPVDVALTLPRPDVTAG